MQECRLADCRKHAMLPYCPYCYHATFSYCQYCPYCYHVMLSYCPYCYHAKLSYCPKNHILLKLPQTCYVVILPMSQTCHIAILPIVSAVFGSKKCCPIKNCVINQIMPSLLYVNMIMTSSHIYQRGEDYLYIQTQNLQTFLQILYPTS